MNPSQTRMLISRLEKTLNVKIEKSSRVEIEQIFSFVSNLGPLMLDPSIFTSDKHLKELLDSKGHDFTLFIPDTLMRLLKAENDVREVLDVIRYFVHPLQINRIKISENWRYIIKVVKPYEAKKQYVNEISSIIEKELPMLSQRAIQILIEEYSFMREHSSLLLKGKQSIQYLKRLTSYTIDATNRFIEKKQIAFDSYKGVRWVIAVIIEIGALGNITTGNVFWAALLGTSGVVLLFFDP